METIREILAFNLARIRGKRSQAQVASDCGFETPTYNRWEKMKAWPDPGSIQRLAEYYGIDASEFYRALPGQPEPKKVILISDALAVMKAVPDEVYELAPDMNEEAWGMVKVIMRREAKKSLRNSSNTKQA